MAIRKKHEKKHVKKHIKKRKILSDYKKAVLLDYIEQKKPKDFLFIPLYFKDELKISDPQAEAQRLFKAKYLSKNSEGEIILEEKAQLFLNDKKEYIDFFNVASPYVTILEYVAMKSKLVEDNHFEYVMISLLKEKLNYYRGIEDADSIQNICEDIACLYLRIGYNEEALNMYLTILYYQVSGLEYYSFFTEYIAKKYSSEKLKKYFTGIVISPEVMKKIQMLKDFYSEIFADKIYAQNKIHINLCTKKQFKEVIGNIIDDKYDSAHWNQEFSNSFNELIHVAEKY